MSTNALRLTALSLALVMLGACSIRSYQTEGDVLYTGIKSIKVEGDKSSKEAEQALHMVEAQLAYPPNNSLFGSSSMRWPLPLFGPWLYLRHADSKTWLGRQLHRLGTKPVWLRDVNPTLRAKVSERILGEQGFLSARIESQLIPNKQDSLRSKVSYTIRLGNLYRLDTIEYLPPIPLSDGTELRHEDISLIRRGNPYSVETLQADRSKFVAKLREEGFYYFNPSLISYEADSLQIHERLKIRTRLQTALAPEVMHPWRIGRMRVRFVDSDADLGQELHQDTVAIDSGITAYYSGRLPMRAKVLNSRLRLRPDSLYRQSTEELTIKNLTNIGVFSSAEMYYRPRTTDSLATHQTGVMDMTILMRLDKPWDVSLGGQVQHKTTNFIGPGATLSLNRRNLFGGGETLGLSATASYEWQLGNSPFDSNTSSINSYQLGLDATLSFPTLLIPGWLDRYYPYAVSTTFKLSGQRLNRAGYYGLNTIGFGLTYDYQPTAETTHNFKLLGIDYTHLAHTTAHFDNILASNPSLLLSLSSQLIPSIGYTYTWAKKVGKSQRNSLWIRTSASEAGNITKSLFMLSGKKFGDRQEILGVPYAQYAKLSTELRYTRYIDRYQSIATRLALGAIYSYGNMQRAPYIEQFYVGGASSIRAFTVRSLGPGSFRTGATSSSYTFMDHVGETKLEMNLEYRRTITQSLEFALFLDAGNVWLLRPDPDRLGGSIGELRSLSDFLNQIAVGTGIGLRYDMSYLLIRLDAGVGLHLPYETSRRGWYNIPKFSDGFGLHLAIGYPF